MITSGGGGMVHKYFSGLLLFQIVRFRSDHDTHQHTHCQHNFYKHHTDCRQVQHTKGQDAHKLQTLTRPHSMQNHTKEQHKESCDPALKLLNEEIISDIQKHMKRTL